MRNSKAVCWRILDMEDSDETSENCSAIPGCESLKDFIQDSRFRRRLAYKGYNAKPSYLGAPSGYFLRKKANSKSSCNAWTRSQLKTRSTRQTGSRWSPHKLGFVHRASKFDLSNNAGGNMLRGRRQCDSAKPRSQAFDGRSDTSSTERSNSKLK